MYVIYVYTWTNTCICLCIESSQGDVLHLFQVMTHIAKKLSYTLRQTREDLEASMWKLVKKKIMMSSL